MALGGDGHGVMFLLKMSVRQTVGKTQRGHVNQFMVVQMGPWSGLVNRWLTVDQSQSQNQPFCPLGPWRVGPISVLRGPG